MKKSQQPHNQLFTHSPRVFKIQNIAKGATDERVECFHQSDLKSYITSQNDKLTSALKSRRNISFQIVTKIQFQNLQPESHQSGLSNRS